MSSAVGELDASLQAMLSLKPPGVSGSKINSITSLCIANVQSESVLVQKLYTHFRRAPGTHKLGVLYVVDSVTRQWVDQAKKAGQPPGTSASDGTFSAGVNRVTELMPTLMTDITQSAPEDQKDKIKKLVDIWERGSTFPAPMLSSFKDKLNAPRNLNSTTPPGTPPQGSQQGQPAMASNAPAPNTSDILAQLAKMAQQNTAVPATGNAASQSSANNVTNAQHAIPQQASSVMQTSALPSMAPSASVAQGGAGAVPQFTIPGMNGVAVQQAAPNASNPLAALASAMPQQASNGGAPNEALQQQLMLIQVLMQQGIPQEQWGPILAALSAQGANANATAGNAGFNAGGLAGAAAASSGWPQNGAQNGWVGRNNQQSRDRSPRSGNYGQRRDRSRSPGWGRNSPPPRKRDSPVYGEYSGGSPGRGGRDDGFGRARGGRGGRGNDYRQRSPPSGPRSPGIKAPSQPGAKVIEWDYSIGKDNIKVLSRTLFVGGVTSSESDLRAIFARFGEVQSCIVNTDKRHAFIKMINRPDAVKAKEGMEQHRVTNMQLRTRWGVGFGPRDCSDYQTGVSIIPIHKLTDADRKWMLSAEFGGTGNKPIEGGMVVEEPDIEIGAGVSSKAISRRMATDQGGRAGPRSSRGGGPEPARGGGRMRRDERPEGPGPAPDSVNAIGVPPAVPGFGFQFNNNGMPVFPAGFTFPGTSQ